MAGFVKHFRPKPCNICGTEFQPTSASALYCPVCKIEVKKQKKLALIIKTRTRLAFIEATLYCPEVAQEMYSEVVKEDGQHQADMLFGKIRTMTRDELTAIIVKVERRKLERQRSPEARAYQRRYHREHYKKNEPVSNGQVIVDDEVANHARD